MFNMKSPSLRDRLSALELENVRLREQVERLLPFARLAYLDPVTGLHNRRYFDERFQEEKERALRTHRPVSLILLDLECFRSFNEVGGQELGDQLLRWFGGFVRENARSFDVTCRIGGDEFAIVLPCAGRAAAELVVERLAQRLGRAGHPHNGPSLPPLRFAAGVATFPHDGAEPVDLLCAADALLFERKRARSIARFSQI